MAPTKQYGNPDVYEKKLVRVMKRIKADKYNYDWGRRSAWVEFLLNGRAHRFTQSIEQAAEHGIKLHYGTDCFAQVVMTIEDLARAGERGIYTLQAILDGLPSLPPHVPDSFRALGFDVIPNNVDDVKARFKAMAKEMHPDSGGSKEAFQKLQDAFTKAVEHLEGKG
ncbi:MAG: J domain-containing protein [Bacillota bacterium]